MSKQFTVARRNTEAIPFTIEGDETAYTFTPPKRSLMVMPILDGSGQDTAAIKVLFDWVGAGLPKRQVDKLKSRLRDPKDDFDVDGLEEIAQWLIEEVSARPTS